MVRASLNLRGGWREAPSGVQEKSYIGVNQRCLGQRCRVYANAVFAAFFYIRFVVEMDFSGRIGVSSPIVSVCVYGFW